MKAIYKKILFALLFIIGLILVILSSYINETLEGNIYITEIRIRMKDLNGNSIQPIIQPAIFYYDFTNQLGNITLGTKENLTIENIQIDFPSQVERSKLKFFYLLNNTLTIIPKSNYTLRTDYTNIYNDGKHASFDFTPKSPFVVNESITLILIFESNIQPNARFNFIFDNNSTLYQDAKAENKGNVQFKLGKNFRCLSTCVSKFENVEETFNSFEGDIRLTWQVDQNRENNIFNLSAYSESKRFWKEILFSIGISLMVSLLVVIIPVPIKIHEFFHRFLNREIKIKGIGEKTLDKIKETIKK